MFSKILMSHTLTPVQTRAPRRSLRRVSYAAIVALGLPLLVVVPSSASQTQQAVTAPVDLVRTENLTYVNNAGKPIEGLEITYSYFANVCASLPKDQWPGNDCRMSAPRGTAVTNASGKVAIRTVNRNSPLYVEAYDPHFYHAYTLDTLPVPSAAANGPRVVNHAPLKAAERYVLKTSSRKARVTGTKTAARDAYLNRYARLVRSEKMVKVNGCTTPVTPKAVQNRYHNAVNYFRDMVGVERIAYDTSMNKTAAKKALVQSRQGFLDHFPAKSKKNCNSPVVGFPSAESLSSGPMGASNVLAYLHDQGSNNLEVGHRIMHLSPVYEKMAIGYARWYNAAHFKTFASDPQHMPLWTQWPSSGYFPSQFEPYGRWSVMSEHVEMDLSAAKVSVKVGSKKLRAKIVSRGQEAVVFQVSKLPKVSGSKVVTVKVTVSGAKRRGKKTADYSYSVKLFEASKYGSKVVAIAGKKKLTVKVKPSSASTKHVPSGKVTVKYGKKKVTKKLNAKGVAAFNMPKGKRTVTVTYAGDTYMAKKTLKRSVRIK